MSLSSSFNLLSFQRKVQDALQSVERTLELERKPRLAADVDHTYGAKYGLVNLTSNAAIIACMNCFEKLGLDAAVLKSIDKTKPATLRFESSTSCKFLKEVEVDVPAARSYEEKEETKESEPSKNTTKTRVIKAINHITEFHWEVESNWSISVYSRTAIKNKKVIKSRTCKVTLITPSKGGLGYADEPPMDLSLTWLLKQIDADELTSQFNVDLEDDGTKTPRRNDAVQQAIDFTAQLRIWCQEIQKSFIFGHLQQIIQQHNPALLKPVLSNFTIKQLFGVKSQYSIFNPILPLMEESGQSNSDDVSNDIELSTIGLQCLNAVNNNDGHEVLLSSKDISNLLNEHVCTLEGAVSGIKKAWPSDSSGSVMSSYEAILSLIIRHLIELSTQYTDTMGYIESMMENQLIAAIGTRLTPHDLDKFVKYHNARLLSPMPQPFSHAIRRPEHYPVGLLTIESKGVGNECIHSHSREVNTTSSLKIPLSAATILELTGQQYLHGYMNHRFGTSNKTHQLVARARQFSAFILVIGTMTDGSTLDPKDAIIIQNKDELIIPLLLDELPTAKEFKDAVKSLSPEQQRFARAYRKMQLASSVFGVCVIQIKPQLEALLGLPADALDKEMKLTQDLMELFVEYQVPSDMLSYSGFAENVAMEDKISDVRDNVKGVLDVINAEKGKQLKAEQAKTEMAMEKAFQQEADEPFMGFSYNQPPSSTMGSFEDRIKKKMIKKQITPFGAAPALLAGAAAPTGPQTFGGAPAPAAGELFGSPAPAPAFEAPRAMASSRRGLVPAPMPTEMSLSFDTPPESNLVHVDTSATITKKEIGDIMEMQQDEKDEATSGEKGQSLPSSKNEGVDFTLIPQILDAAVEKSGEGNALRSTTIKTGNDWARNRQENLLTRPKKQSLDAEEIKKEKNKAFDLLDALSRSGSLPIAYSDLHVIVAVTHCFDKGVMSTVICDNINPIEKLECSTLLLASAVHGIPARDLIIDVSELQRLEKSMPLLLQSVGNNEEGV